MSSLLRFVLHRLAEASVLSTDLMQFDPAQAVRIAGFLDKPAAHVD